MRTTLDLDDDILAAAKEIARRDRTSAGAVVSRLVRQSLTGTSAASRKPRDKPNAAGFRPFPKRAGVIITNEQINALRDIEGV